MRLFFLLTVVGLYSLSLNTIAGELIWPEELDDSLQELISLEELDDIPQEYNLDTTEGRWIPIPDPPRGKVMGPSQLVSYFRANNIPYHRVADYAYNGSTGSYHYDAWPYQAPAIKPLPGKPETNPLPVDGVQPLHKNDTMMVFAELYVGNALDKVNKSLGQKDHAGSIHFAIGIRGPHGYNYTNDPNPPSPPDNTNYAGSGIAIGNLGDFLSYNPIKGVSTSCTDDTTLDRGAFLENFSTNAYTLPADKVNHPKSLQLTYCQPYQMPSQRIYRIELQVSHLNVYATVYRKDWGIYKNGAKFSCSLEYGPNKDANNVDVTTGKPVLLEPGELHKKDINHCPVHISTEIEGGENSYGGFFLGTGGQLAKVLDAKGEPVKDAKGDFTYHPIQWAVKNIYLAILRH